MAIENKMHILLRKKEENRSVLGTGITQVAREFDLHENTVRKMFKKTVSSGGYFENDHWMMIVTWEVVKGNRGYARNKNTA